MSGTVYLRTWRTFFSPSGRRDEELIYVEGMRLRDVVPEERLSESGFTVLHNSVSERDLSRPLCPGDLVDLVVRPHDPTTIISTTLINLAIAFAASLVVNLLIGKPKGPKKRKDDESTQYGWSGLVNNRGEGQPRQVIYGEVRMAPQVIDEFVVSQPSPPISTLYQLLAFGEGPITAIGDVTVDNAPDTPLSSSSPTNPIPRGIQVNGNNLQNFDAVEAHVRMGTSEQLPIPGFELIATDYEVGATLTQQETTSTSNTGYHPDFDLNNVAFNSNAAAVQSVWNQYGFSFDMTSSADEWKSVIGFTQGLYKLSASGGLQDAGFQMVARYMELDGAGAPITSGGDNADGWVYVRPELMFFAHQQTPFSLEFGGRLISPTGYVPGFVGKCLDAIGASQYAATAALTAGQLPAGWTASAFVPAMSCAVWVKFNNLPVASGSTTARGLAEWSNGTGNGFGLSLVATDYDSGGGSSSYFWVPTGYIGTTSGAVTMRPSGTVNGGQPSIFVPALSTAWHRVLITYAKDPATNVRARLRLYFNGKMIVEKQYTSTAFQMKAPSAASQLTLARDLIFNSGVAAYGACQMDEAFVVDKEMTSVEVHTDYDFGRGLYGVSSANVVGGYHFDAGAGTNDYGPRGNNLTLSGGATAGSVNGLVYTAGSGTARRFKARVQLLRLNQKSTSTRVADESVWDTLYGLIDEHLSYPWTPLLALKIKATEQLNTTAPTTTALVKGRPLQIWDGASETTPNFAEAWSANTAWVCLDVATNKRYGRGIDFGWANVDLPSFKLWADYCDGLIYDGRGRLDIHETDADAEIAEMRYVSTLFSGYGGIEIFFRAGFTPPALWLVGSHLGFSGLPAPPTAGVSVNINSTHIAGFEIGTLAFNGAVWVVTIKYDTTTYGAPWTDGAFITTVIAATVTGTVEGKERRFRYDGVRDTFRNAWDELIDIAATARGMPVLEGDTLRMKYDRARPFVALITNANIQEGSFRLEYTDKTSTPNSLSCDFQDKDQNYALSPVSVDDPALDGSALEEEIVRDSITLEGVTRRSQVLRHLQYMLNVNRIATRHGSFKAGLDMVAIEPGDIVALAHDIVPWGKSGRVLDGCTATTLKLDREVTISGVALNFMRIHLRALGQSNPATGVTDYIITTRIDTAVTTPGTYPAGSTITLQATLVAAPEKGDPYSLFVEGQDFLAQIVDGKLDEDFAREFRWIKYDSSIYDVDTLPHDLPTSVDLSDDEPGGDRRMPGPVSNLTVSETPIRQVDGGVHSRMVASWVLEDESVRYVAGVRVYAREGGGTFELVATAHGPARSVVFDTPNPSSGAEIEVAAVPYSYSGAVRTPYAAPTSSIVIRGAPFKPAAPLSFTATQEFDHAIYAVVPGTPSAGLVHEIRRGGWILGQPVAVIPAGQTRVESSNMIGGASNTYGETAPPLYVRARDQFGQYSDALLLDTFNPFVPGATLLPSIPCGNEAWETYGTGWTAGTWGNSTLTGLVIATLDSGRQVLEFDGSALTGTYETALFLLPFDIRQPERVYLDAFVRADQIPALTVDYWTLPIDSPAAERRTIEGPLVVFDGEPANVTLLIEVRWRTDHAGVLSDWTVYRPGIVRMLYAQFRLTFTRPNTGYQVRVLRFSTRAMRIPPQRNERSDAHHAFIGNI